MVKRLARYVIVGVLALAVLAGLAAWGRNLYYFAGASEPRLSQTGLYADIATLKLASGVMRFAPQHHLWSDGADKVRYIALPNHKQIDTRNPEGWNFPQGTRLWKEFVRDGVVVETRMLFKTGPGPADWDMATYLWRPNRSDAEKIAFSKGDAGGTAHDVPGPKDCVSCHGNGEERRPLGFSPIQLPWTHPEFLSVASLAAKGLLSHPPKHAFAIPGDAITQAALGYLHANCGSCHYEGSRAVRSAVPLRLNLSSQIAGDVGETNAYRSAIEKRATTAGLGADTYIVPGRPKESFVWRRMAVRDNGAWQMPPVATEEVDQDGVAKVGRWITHLKAPVKP